MIDEDEGIRIRIDIVFVYAVTIWLRPFHAIIIDQILKLAVAGYFTSHALVGMVGEKHAEHEFAGTNRCIAHSVDDHALAGGSGAGGLQPSRSLHRNDAHAAGADILQVGMMAEGGDFDPGRTSGI